MTRARAAALGLALSALVGATPALAEQQMYTYSVMHPIYGQIGMLTNTINRDPEGMRIDAHLRITVELLGIVFYHQETDITEIMRGNRLVSLQSVSDKDGRHSAVHGEIQGDQFVVKTTAGSFAGPASIFPSDPWVLNRAGEATVVYPDTGRIITLVISGGEYDPVFLNGASVTARHFIVMGEKRQEVWLDNRGIPIMFRSIEDGTPIDFVMQTAVAALGFSTVATFERLAPARPRMASK
jgi:hypothetical protein